jgi:hypothetical protein
MLGCLYYGSTNETYKIAYSQQALASCYCKHQFYEVRKLPGFKETPHRLLCLRFLPRKKGFGFDKKDRKETKES